MVDQSTDDQITNAAEEITDEKPPSEDITEEDQWLDILGNGQLKKKITRKGEGKDSRPERGKTLIINFKAWLQDDTLVEECRDLELILGDSDVIQGLDMVLALMEKGEIAEVLIPSRLAYGKIGRLPEIPSNSDLKFEVEICEVQETPDEDSLSFDERMKLGEKKKEKGNFWYAQVDYTQAIHCYRRALDFFDNDVKSLTGPEEELQQLLEARLKVYNNMAAAQLKINAFDAAAKSLDFVLKAQPNNVKALFRKGKVYIGNGNIDQAIKTLKMAVKLEPESKIIHQELSKLLTKKKNESINEKEMYRKMLGQDKLQTEQPSSKIGKWSLAVGAIAAVAMSYFAARHFLLSPPI